MTSARMSMGVIAVRTESARGAQAHAEQRTSDTTAFQPASETPQKRHAASSQRMTLVFDRASSSPPADVVRSCAPVHESGPGQKCPFGARVVDAEPGVGAETQRHEQKQRRSRAALRRRSARRARQTAAERRRSRRSAAPGTADRAGSRRGARSPARQGWRRAATMSARRPPYRRDGRSDRKPRVVMVAPSLLA